MESALGAQRSNRDLSPDVTFNNRDGLACTGTFVILSTMLSFRYGLGEVRRSGTCWGWGWEEEV